MTEYRGVELISTTTQRGGDLVRGGGSGGEGYMTRKYDSRCLFSLFYLLI